MNRIRPTDVRTLTETLKKEYLHTGSSLAWICDAWLADRTMGVTWARNAGVLLISAHLARWRRHYIQLAFTPLWKTSNKLRATHPSRSVESSDACLTVDSSCVVTAANTDSTPSFLTMDVQAEWQVCYCLIKVALLCLAMAVTLWKHTQTMLVLYFIGLLSPAGGCIIFNPFTSSTWEFRKTSKSCFEDSTLRVARWPWAMCYLKGPERKSGSSISLSWSSPFSSSKIYN